jgi:hypothetical protein
VNLTEHQVVLDAFEQAAAGEDPGATPPSVVRLPPEGRPARVRDDRARLSQRWLNTGTGLVRLTRLRRSSDLVDLPPPKPGARYVVSRITALAARRRGDLVFPFGEHRDPAGRITRVSGLATFRPGWALRHWYRDWRTAACGRRARKPLGSQALTGVLFAMATALLSGALALLPGAADNAQQNGWAGGGQFWASWLTVCFGVAGLAVLGAAAWRWRRRAVIVDERGTAYVIEEQAIAWRHEEKESVLTAIGKGFASTLRVPGPDALGDNWHWQVDAEGAARWDERTDQLVRSFWAVHYNDDQVTRNALFTWAPWPVAMAFGARATARRRGLVLHVRQRPSYGAAGPRQQLRLTDTAHEFLRDKRPAPLEQTAPEHCVKHLQGRLAVTVEPLGLSNAAAAHPYHAARAAGRSGPAGQDAAGQMLLLLVRVTHGPIGPIPMTLAHTRAMTAYVSHGLAGSLIPAGTHTVVAAEWRLDSKTQPVPQLPWEAFPAAAESIADWVVEQASAHPGHVVLLATRIPQELAVGLGIQLGQRAHAWPRQAYPVYFVSERLVVPELMLGAESVPAERA